MEKIKWWKTNFGDDEIQMLTESVSHGHISQGPVTEEFEAHFAKALDVPFAVATTSGSVALLMSLMALGIQRDDEIIMPNRTFIATAHAAMLLGAKPVLVDVLPEIPVMDIADVRSKITSRTKAILPVHLNGRSVDTAGLNEICDEYSLHMIEDACQSLYSRNADGFLGTQSDMGCFSLGMTKLISTGQGGVIVTKSEELNARLRLIRNHGVVDTFAAKYSQVGMNFKFTDILASLGLAQMRRMDERLAHINTVYQKYCAGVEDLPFLKMVPVNVSKGEIPLWAEVLCPERQDLRNFLETKGVESRPFLPDVHLSPHLNVTGEFPRSKIFGDQGIFLPSGPGQRLEDIDHVIELLGIYGDL